MWFADEWVGPLRVSGRFFVVDAEPGSFFAYRVGFPASLIRAGGSFRVLPSAGEECELVETAHFGFRLPVAGAVIDGILRLVLPLDEFRRHVREEGEGLVRIFALDQD